MPPDIAAGLIPPSQSLVLLDCQGNMRTDFCDLDGNILYEVAARLAWNLPTVKYTRLSPFRFRATGAISTMTAMVTTTTVRTATTMLALLSGLMPTLS